MPWCSDGPGEAELGGTLETTLSHWADACHEQGGTVVHPAPSEPELRAGGADRDRPRRRGRDGWSKTRTCIASTTAT